MTELITVNKTIKLTKIAICGQARAGKDEVAQRLRLYHDYRALAFADELKRLAHRAFPHIERNPKPRKLYQDFGEALCAIDSQVWIRHVEREITDYISYIASSQYSDANIVVTDLRKPSEYEWARANNFTIVRVTAPEEIRLERARKAGDTFELADLAHDTEQHVAGFDVDFEIVNDGTLQDLYAKVDEVIRKINDQVR